MSGNELPDDIQELKKRVIELHNQVVQKDQKINHLQDMVNLLQRKKYAPQSEQVNWDQMGLFNEMEDLANAPSEKEDSEVEDEKKRSPTKEQKIQNVLVFQKIFLGKKLLLILKKKTKFVFTTVLNLRRSAKRLLRSLR